MTVVAYAIVGALVFFLGCLAFEELEGVGEGLVSKAKARRP